MEQLAEQQQATGNEIQKIIDNYKKDSQSRKDLPYLKERLRRLEEAWHKFEVTDNVIRTQHGKQLQHQYFAKDYYNAVKTIFEKYQEEFESKMKALSDEDPATNNQQDSLKGNESGQVATIEEIKRVIRKQKGVIESLNRLLTSLKDDSQDLSKQYYEVKLKTIQHYWSQIEHYNALVWELSEDTAKVGYVVEEYLRWEERVQQALISLTQNMNKLPKQTSNTTSGDNTTIKLPKITLPTFDGDYLKWTQFHDLYEQLIHSQNISNAQKMFYLTSSLSGDAKALIQHLPVTEANYDTAWDILKSRYENKRLLCTALLNKFLTQPNLQYESAVSLKCLHDVTKECMLGLNNLGINTESWDPFLVHLIIKKFDKGTHTLYEQSLKKPRDLPALNDLLNFLEMRFQALESLGRDKHLTGHERTASRSNIRNTRSSALTSTTRPSICAMCKKNHPLHACREFLMQPPTNRCSILKKNNLCTNCMKEGHPVTRCTSRNNCAKCSKRHNTLLHVDGITKQAKTDQSASSSTQRQPVNNKQVIQNPMQIVTNASHPVTRDLAIKNTIATENPTILAARIKQSKSNYVLLGTALIELSNHEGKTVQCRAILDSGSQLNFMTESLAKKLGLRQTTELMHISGIGEHSQEAQHRVNVLLRSRVNNFSTRLEAFILPKITTYQPERTIDINSWPIPHNIELADPEFNHPGRIEFLIGAELYHELMSIGQIKLGPNLPTLQNTAFGWVVTGAIRGEKPVQATCGICSEDERTEKLLEKFWNLEEVDSSDESTNLTVSEQKCVNHFNQNVRRTKEGRFIVKLPFSNNTNVLGESRDIALKRFLSLERKFSRHPTIKSQYVDFMNEYSKLGHMKEVSPTEITKPHYFLPHHCVIKPDSNTTRLRVVYDASAKTSSNISLNDVLYKGPTTQDELFSILIRFRLPRFVFTADIEKMYRQVLLDDADQNYQLILWRDDPNESMKYYKLCTVTYGVTSAPFLATKCLQLLAETERIRYPLGSEVLKRDFYVDDVMTGSNSLAEVKEMQRQLKQLLQSAGFNLRKWCANHPQLLQDIPREDIALELNFNEDTEEHIKTLGLTWLPKTDVFAIKTTWQDTKRITKRTVLSDIAHIFDPLGFVNPVTVTAKIFIQKLWSLKLDWDAALPIEMHTSWLKFREGLKALNDINIPRQVASTLQPNSVQIHAFSDASERAYGAAIYIRSITQDGVVMVRLLCAKSKVAPIKTTTLPRLELCAAKLSAQLTQRIVRDMKLQSQRIYYWTDSEIVLAWIASESSCFHTFVANRVASIQRLTNIEQWRHVRSSENPADIVSRGIPAERLQNCSIWFYGPPFLHGSERIWPAKYSKVDIDLEKKKSKIVLTASREYSPFSSAIKHGNSIKKLQKIMGYVLRFIHNARQHRGYRRSESSLSIQELDEALVIILKEVQQEGFKEDITQLRRIGTISNSSALNSLSPFLDEKGVVRVGGRLEHSNLSYDAKHPILLPYSHPVTKLLMTDIHISNLHAGPQTLLAITRQRFWPIRGKTIARSIVQHCVRCNRVKPKHMTQLMGNLPAARVQPARPFINSGVDFCGPIWTHFKLRGKRPQKSYIAVFCCFSTKATHLEVVSDLTTEGFLGALKRFIARRGHCLNLHCDNATNFVGARNQLSELQDILYSNKSQEKISSMCQEKGMEFHFIPPRAPHFGGLWEAAVKSAKSLLHKGVASASLTYEELSTVTAEIEAILNSRPITPLSSNPNDLTALTPGHFLIGEPLTSRVDPQSISQQLGPARRWKLVSHIKNEFWRRWSHEYLCELQQRHKWKQQAGNARPGMMVLIKEDNLPPLKWQLGRITQAIKGNDGLVRVADVKTTSGTFRRPIHKLAPLPVDNEDDPQATQEEPPKRKTNRDREDAAPTKISRPSTSSALSAFLITCLIMPILGISPVEISPFKSQPGIYFESLGSTHLISNEWNLVVYYDMDNYWKEFNSISDGISKLQKICDLSTDITYCSLIIKQFTILKDELISNNELLLTNPRKRVARAPLNIVGNIASSLFGVLDSEYAEKMASTIDNIRHNEDHLLNLMKNQTSLIDSTANILKKDEDIMQSQFNEVELRLHQIINHINNITEEFHQQKLAQLFTSLAIQITLMSSTYRRAQATILDVIIDTHHGKINPQLLSPRQLKEELITIKDHLPSTLKLPGNRDNLIQVYSLMTIEGRVAEKYIIFRIKLPLFAYEEFELFRVIPVPVAVNNTFLAIKPSADFIVINLHRDQYYPLSEQELGTCVTIEEATHMCKQKHPVYRKGANISACEMSFISHLAPSSSCQIMKTENSPKWIQLYNPNQWIYSMKQKTTINVVCGTTVLQQVLEGAGILKIQSNCAIKQELITIQAHNVYPSMMKTSFLPTENLVDFISSNRLKEIHYSPMHHQTHNDELEKLHKGIAEIRLRQQLPNKIKAVDIHQFTLGYLALALGLLIAAFLVYRWKKQKVSNPRPNKDTPARTTSGPFTINIREEEV